MENLASQNTSDYRYGPLGSFKKSFIKEIVVQLEAGVSHRELGARFGLSPNTIRRWGNSYGDAAKIPVRRKSVTPVLRRSVARAVVEGNLTIKTAARTYGVSIRAVEVWVAAEKRELYTTNSIVLNKSEKEQTADLPAPVEDEVKRLQEQLAEANLRIAALNTLIDVAEEQLNINIRKKPGAKQS